MTDVPMRPLKAHVIHAEKIAAAVPSAHGDGEKRSTGQVQGRRESSKGMPEECLWMAEATDLSFYCIKSTSQMSVQMLESTKRRLLRNKREGIDMKWFVETEMMIERSVFKMSHGILL